MSRHARAVEQLADRYGLDVELAPNGHIRLVDRVTRKWVLTAGHSPKRPEMALREIERDLRRRERGQY